MNRIFLALAFSGFFSLKSSAQYYFYDKDYYDNPVTFEIGGSAGIMNCLTDLGGRKGIGKKFIKDLNIGNTQFNGSVFGGFTYKHKFSIRLEATFGQVKAYDSILKSVKATTYGRYERNLSFRSPITEIALSAEIHPLHIFINWQDREESPPNWSPYLLAGVSSVSFNPQAKLNGNWVDLQPLRTEGQGFKEYPNRKEYKLRQMSFPFGLGLKYEFSPLINFRAECVYRFMQTDYLDDASTEYIDQSLFANYLSGSRLTNALLLNDRQYELDPTHITVPTGQRANPNNNDGFFTFNLKASLVLGRQRR